VCWNDRGLTTQFVISDLRHFFMKTFIDRWADLFWLSRRDLNSELENCCELYMMNVGVMLALGALFLGSVTGVLLLAALCFLLGAACR
jgi:hypothetical protein